MLKHVNSNQYRYCAKHKFKQKHYMAGIFNYLKYYKMLLKIKVKIIHYDI
ncbi:glycosyltransferase family 8 C-terminal domain-containing protein [Escherichia coli]